MKKTLKWTLLLLLVAAALCATGLAEEEAASSLPVMRSDPYVGQGDEGAFEELDPYEAYPDLPPVLGSEYARSEIRSIRFADSLADAPEDAWDVSEAGDGSVLAWTVPAGELRDLTIAGEGGVRAPENCADLFFDYENLSSVQFNGCFDTSGATDMSGMFKYCWSLEEADLQGINTANVTDMSEMFSCCASLWELDLTGFDTARVTDMSWMFESCNCLEELDLSGFDTANVENMDHMFDWCGGLLELDLSSFRTPKLASMTQMFQGCGGLAELDLHGFDTSKIEDMAELFANCFGLEELDLSRFDTRAVTRMDKMFYNCESLTLVRATENFQIPDGAKDMFLNCKIDGVTVVEIAAEEAGEENDADAEDSSGEEGAANGEDSPSEEAAADGEESAGEESAADGEDAPGALQNGDRGDAVAKLQQALIDAGALDDVADGIFGPKTEEAVRAMQEQLGLDPTGIADATFLKQLYEEG